MAWVCNGTSTDSGHGRLCRCQSLHAARHGGCYVGTVCWADGSSAGRSNRRRQSAVTDYAMGPPYRIYDVTLGYKPFDEQPSRPTSMGSRRTSQSSRHACSCSGC